MDRLCIARLGASDHEQTFLIIDSGSWKTGPEAMNIFDVPVHISRQTNVITIHALTVLKALRRFCEFIF